MTDPDLVAFARRCLNEDERVALAIQGDRYGDNDDGGWKHWTIEQRDDRPWPYLGALGMELGHSYADNVITPQRGEHIARWDPARVLDEVEAKRAMLDWAVTWLERDCAPWNADLIRMLALPYAGRDGWREEWRDG